MEGRFLGSVAVLAIVGAAAAFTPPRVTDGPPPGFSGGFGEPSCVTCHLGNDVNAFGGQVRLAGLPAAYEPGTEYVLTVVLEAEETAVAGFQVTARFADAARMGRNAGRLGPLDERVSVADSAGVSYAHQTLVGSTTSNASGSSWALKWTAPQDGGPVTLNVTANSGNADKSPLGDLVYADEVTLPSARTRSALPQSTEPDSARLLRQLGVLAHDSMEGRATGTPGAQRARDFLTTELRAAGIESLTSQYEHGFTVNGGQPATNLIAQIEGSGGGGVIVLSAHYDHLGLRGGEIFNGADDNASGTIAVLEMGRIFEATPLRSSVILVFFDAEEAGLEGAKAFLENPPLPIEQISLNVNLDMVSRSGGLLWASGAHHTPALRPILEGVAAAAPATLRLGHDRPNAPEGDDWTTSSDHGPFHTSGVPFVYFGVEDHPDYHRPTDDAERVDPGEYVNSVRTILSALRALDAALPLAPSEDAP